MSQRYAQSSGTEGARMTVEEVSARFRCSVQDLSEAIRRGLLRPLGHPAPQNAVKFFCRVEIEELCQSKDFLDKLTRCLYRYHTSRNRKAKERVCKLTRHDTHSQQTPSLT